MSISNINKFVCLDTFLLTYKICNDKIIKEVIEMSIAEKFKAVRLANDMTQEEFAKTLGISRGNLANIEIGKVEPTSVLINCVSMMYQVDKDWILNDNHTDMEIKKATDIVSLIMTGYEKLDDNYKLFVQNQIEELLELQEKEKQKYINGLDNGD